MKHYCSNHYNYGMPLECDVASQRPWVVEGRPLRTIVLNLIFFVSRQICGSKTLVSDDPVLRDWCIPPRNLPKGWKMIQCQCIIIHVGELVASSASGSMAGTYESLRTGSATSMGIGCPSGGR